MIINKLFIFLILSFRPIFGSTGCCRFELSCTDYAILELSNSDLIKALRNIFNRIIKCQPFYLKK